MDIKKRVSAAFMSAVMCIAAVPAVTAKAETVHNYDVVSDFGAVPNDNKADTASIQKALNMAEGLSSGEKIEVTVPDGVYRIDNCLGISSNTTLKLSPNAIIINDNEEKVMLYNKGDNKSGYNCSANITVTGGTWDGNAPNTSITHSDALFVFTHTKNLNLSDMTLKNERANHFVICDGIDGLKVENTVFKDFYDFKGDPLKYFVCEGVTDPEKRKSAVGAVEALHIDYASEDNTPCKNVEVTGCTFQNVPAGVGTHHMYSGKYAENISVHNNSFNNVRFSCARGANFRKFKFFDNTIKNSGGMFRADGSEAEVYNNNFTGLSKVDYNVYPKNSILYSVLVMDSSDVDLHDNAITRSKGTGVFYKNNCKGKIRGNLISDCVEDGVSVEDSNVSITGNDISGCKTDGIRATGSVVSVTGNSIIGVGKNTFDIYKGCKSSVIKENGIEAAAKIYCSDDSGVSISGNGTSISLVSVSAIENSYNYRGKEIKPVPKVIFNGKVLSGGNDYSLSYSSNINAGTAMMCITGKGSYRGTLKKQFDIKPVSLSDSKIKIKTALSSYAYTGSAVEPDVIVKYDGDTLKTSDYSVSYSNNIEPGKASVTVTARSGNLKGTASATFTINPDASTLDKGDISGNGVIDLYDAIEIAKSLIGTRKFTEEEKKVADFNGDGKVDLYDVIAIAKYLLKT